MGEGEGEGEGRQQRDSRVGAAEVLRACRGLRCDCRVVQTVSKLSPTPITTLRVSRMALQLALLRPLLSSGVSPGPLGVVHPKIALRDKGNVLGCHQQLHLFLSAGPLCILFTDLPTAARLQAPASSPPDVPNPNPRVEEAAA